MTDDKVEAELLNFQFEPITETVIPGFKKSVSYKNKYEVWAIIENMLNELEKNVEITYFSIIFSKCMSYEKNRENLAYDEDGLELKLFDLSIQFKTCINVMPKIFRKAILGDNILAYTLYLREKIFQSDSIVYYDLDQNRISYVKNNILQMDSNPVFGMMFPRYTREQKELFQKLKETSGKQYTNILMENKEILLTFIKSPYIQIKSLLNPEHFIIGGNWIKKLQFEQFFFFNNTFFFNEYQELSTMLFAENSSLIHVMNMDEQPQKGAGIYAAYSFFNWKFRW